MGDRIDSLNERIKTEIDLYTNMVNLIYTYVCKIAHTLSLNHLFLEYNDH